MGAKTIEIWQQQLCLQVVEAQARQDRFELETALGTLSLSAEDAAREAVRFLTLGQGTRAVLHWPGSLNDDALQRWISPEMQVVPAAGGLVFTPDQRLLMIHRKGHWDLPKGKVDPGERLEDAAVREVEEETGLSGVQLKAFYRVSYHVYAYSSRRMALKPSYWYIMAHSGEGKLVPQAEEGIREARWMTREDWQQRLPDMFNTIRGLLTRLPDRWPE